MVFYDKYSRSAFSVDNVIFGFDGEALKVLLIKRNSKPYEEFWALPGELVKEGEDLDAAPMRVLKELTGLHNVYLEQVHTFGKVDRHPKGRVITVAYYSLVNIHKVYTDTTHLSQEVDWVDVREIKALAFDHYEIMSTCLRKLKAHLRFRPIGFELLEEKFTLTELQALYEAVLERELDKRNFRKKVLSMKILEDIQEYQQGVAHRPAKLFKFNKEKYVESQKEGFIFDVL